MLDTPRTFCLVAGAAEAQTRLTAFDRALLEAGIGNVNLVKMSSILPPHAKEAAELRIPPGSLVPTAYGAMTSEHPGELIAAAVAVGIGPADDYGVIMEFSGRCTKQEAEAAVRAMVEEAFLYRERTLERVLVQGVEHRVDKIGCVLAACVLWN